jgi:3-oxoacyl-[acyl-carrier protein] reductase
MITVNAVLPGNIRTEGLSEMADDIGHLAAFLTTDEARYITGQSIVVDGGQILRESLDALAG